MGIAADDRAGLERLLRFCARPCFAAERVHPAPDGEGVVYELAKPRPDGTRRLTLGSFAFLDRRARLIPEPRRHKHRYHGVFAPNASLRSRVTERAGQPVAPPSEAAGADTQALHPAIQAVQGTGESQLLPTPAPPGASRWTRLIARIDETDHLVCPDCGGRMHLIAFTVDPTAITRILEAIDEPALAPRAAPIREPPAAEHPMVAPLFAHDLFPSYEDQERFAGSESSRQPPGTEASSRTLRAAACELVARRRAKPRRHAPAALVLSLGCAPHEGPRANLPTHSTPVSVRPTPSLPCRNSGYG